MKISKAMQGPTDELRQIIDFDPADAVTLTTAPNGRHRVKLKKTKAAKVCQTDGNTIVFPDKLAAIDELNKLQGYYPD